jgi:hypothetical protein
VVNAFQQWLSLSVAKDQRWFSACSFFTAALFVAIVIRRETVLVARGLPFRTHVRARVLVILAWRGGSGFRILHSEFRLCRPRRGLDQLASDLASDGQKSAMGKSLQKHAGFHVCDHWGLNLCPVQSIANPCSNCRNFGPPCSQLPANHFVAKHACMISTIFEDGLSFDAWVDYKIFDVRRRHTEFKVKQCCETDLSREIPGEHGPRANAAIADFCPSLACSD